MFVVMALAERDESRSFEAAISDGFALILMKV
jgi:hypothetical protein